MKNDTACCSQMKQALESGALRQRDGGVRLAAEPQPSAAFSYCPWCGRAYARAPFSQAWDDIAARLQAVTA